MKIEILNLGHVFTNCYLISTDKAKIVVDPAKFDRKLEDFLNSDKDAVKAILLTHAHFDHIGGAKELSDKTGVKIYIGKDENDSLSDTEKNLSDRFRAHISPFSADILLTDGEKFNIGDITVKTVFTPGHTTGGVCYLLNDTLISGDTLFFESIGRTDFPGGNLDDLLSSIKKLFRLLSDDTAVYPGHGEKTTIGYEKLYNPFLR